MKIQAALAALLLATPAFAAVINGSFEDGLNGWTKTAGGMTYYTTGADGEVDLDNPVEYPFDPTTNPWFDGSWRIAAGGIHGAQHVEIEHSGIPPSDYYEFVAPDGSSYWFVPEPPLWVGLYQDIALTAGETLLGWAAFDTSEYIPDFRDFARVTVDGEVVWHKHISDILVYDEVLDIWIVPEIVWEEWSFLAPTSGTFRLQFELHTDDQIPSTGLFDHVRIIGAAGVPDSTATAWLMVLALAALGCLARRFPTAAARQATRPES